MQQLQNILPNQQAIESLRERERRRYHVSPIANALANEARALRKDARAFGDLGSTLNALLPEELTESTTLAAVSRGTLTLAANSASTRYALDAWLRAGGERSIKQTSRANIKRVRVVLQQASTNRRHP